jgi:hypothetical protein
MSFRKVSVGPLSRRTVTYRFVEGHTWASGKVEAAEHLSFYKTPQIHVIDLTETALLVVGLT